VGVVVSGVGEVQGDVDWVVRQGLSFKLHWSWPLGELEQRGMSGGFQHRAQTAKDTTRPNLHIALKWTAACPNAVVKLLVKNKAPCSKF
jgi:hypothetical protein